MNGKNLAMATAKQMRLEAEYRDRLSSFLASVYGEGKLETNDAFDYVIRQTIKGVRI